MLKDTFKIGLPYYEQLLAHAKSPKTLIKFFLGIF
jgi:hypothetical protein